MALRHSPLFVQRASKRARVDEPGAAVGADADAGADEDPLPELPDDTMAALQLLRGQFESLALPAHSPPLVLVHQLYSVVASKTTVDRDIEAARQAKRVIKLRLPAAEGQFVVVLWRDYERGVERAAATSPEQLAAVLTRLLKLMSHVDTDVAIARTVFKVETGSSDSDIAELVRAGFLMLRDGNSLWFTLPCMGNFAVQLAGGRGEILAMLKRKKFHEMLEKLLVQKTLRKSQLGWEYHLSDLLGIKAIEYKHTSEGNLVRVLNL